ncbi:hypothetical protein, partial [Escherichia coli]|uniref:hypothetical protein n=1 Tax=Escherichia coli TaxID=562 RepID=UPI001BDC0251
LMDMLVTVSDCWHSEFSDDVYANEGSCCDITAWSIADNGHVHGEPHRKTAGIHEGLGSLSI